MSLILCIETETDVCSVALARDGQLVSLRESPEGRDHARQVAVYADEVIRAGGVTPCDLDAVAIGQGPGSYTGLRIGTSFAKGMCYALGIPLVAIGSLRSMANIGAEEHREGRVSEPDWAGARLCPMIDARRMEVYAQVFDTSLTPLSEVVAEVVTPESFSEFTGNGHELIIFGNGARKCIDILPSEHVRMIEVSPSARGICWDAHIKLTAGEVEDIAYFEPLYLKDFVVTTSKKKLF